MAAQSGSFLSYGLSRSSVGHSSSPSSSSSSSSSSQPHTTPSSSVCCPDDVQVEGVFSWPLCCSWAVTESTIQPKVPTIPISTQVLDSLQATYHCKALKVETKRMGDLQKLLKAEPLHKFTLALPRVPAIVGLESDPSHHIPGCSTGMPAPLGSFLSQHEDWIVVVDSHTHTRTYDQLSYEEVISRIVPPPVPLSFQTVGHLAHLNLLDHQLPYRHVIALVLLQKHPHLRTVVRKVGELSNEFRTLPMELIGGQPDYIALVKENNMRFEVDVEHVYWNSRLSSERERICDEVSPGSLVCDVFSGVGGFGLYLARQRCCVVLSNDLNPHCYTAMQTNAKLNRVQQPDVFSAYNMDGRVFIRKCLQTVNELLIRRNGELAEDSDGQRMKQAVNKWKDYNLSFHSTDTPRATRQVHFLMNLPELALDYLNEFRSLVDYHCFQTCEASSSSWTGGSRVSSTMDDPPPNPSLSPSPSPPSDFPISSPLSCSSSIPPPLVSPSHFPEGPPLRKRRFCGAPERPARRIKLNALELIKKEEEEDMEKNKNKTETCIVVYVHCYCFLRTGDKEITNLLRKRLGCCPSNFTLRRIREVAPSKTMYCVRVHFSGGSLCPPPPESCISS